MITKDDICFSLELMDIHKGDTLLLHSALTAIGPVEGGADTVDRKSTRLNSSHPTTSRMPSSA